MSDKPTVIAAMSGGVDSSVAAALLKQQGYNVIGATLRLRPCGDDDNAKWCCSRGAEEQSRAVAGVLEIPHYVIDASDTFEEEILRPAWEEYDGGRTPSPCIRCNDRIKFKLLMDLGKKLGADHVATGHYARVAQTPEGPHLLRGKDPTKDQSYFLFSLSPEYLRAALFPLGDLLKTEVRKLAKKFQFANAERKDSQDACFSYGEEGFAEALRIRFNAVSRPGSVINIDGERIGDHQGIHLYTVGQRKGLRIAVGKRAYVCRIDPKKDKVVLTADLKDLECKMLYASGITWTGGIVPGLPLRCEAQIRYRHLPAKAEARLDDTGKMIVQFDRPESAAAPGQAVVLFDGERVLGGGWIDRTESGQGGN
jgi:tRNA-specific 2-thiouridylase